ADDLTHHFILYEENGVIIILMIALNMIERADQLLLARKLHLHLGEQVFIGIGSLCNELEKLPISYRQAYEASLQLKANGQSKYGFVSKVIQNNDQVVPDILSAIKKGSFEEAMLMFKES